MLEQKLVDALEACSRCHCGCCKDGCPVYGTVLEEQLSARGRNLIIRAYLQGSLEADDRMARALYSCLLCRLDEESCLARVPNAEIYEAVRQELLSKGIGPLPEHAPLLASLRNYGNPWMQPKSSRDRWVKQLKRDDKAKGSGVLYFAGCTFSLAPELNQVPKSTAALMKMAGIEFDLQGREELCCGSTALRLGDRALFEELSKRNTDKIRGYDRIVTSCAGCFKTMSHDYGESQGADRISHSVQLFSEMIKSGKLRPHKLDLKVTYHDPCHLGRHSGLYDPPREIIKAIPGLKFIEMKNSREFARCCGAGAGVKTADPALSGEIAFKRLQEAVDTDAEVLVTACPFCEQNLSEVAKARNMKIRIMDISELLLEACK